MDLVSQSKHYNLLYTGLDEAELQSNCTNYIFIRDTVASSYCSYDIESRSW